MSWAPSTDSAGQRRPAVRSPLARHALGPLGYMPHRGPSAPPDQLGADPIPADRSALATRLRHAAGPVVYASSQLFLIALLYGVYSFSRHLADGREPQALRSALEVWRLERFLHLPSEVAVQNLALHSTTLISGANWYYICVHFPSIVALLLWVFVRHRGHWPRVRNALILATGLALTIHLLYPLAPPRFLSRVSDVSLVDTGAVYGPSPYGNGDRLANEYAAMPSLHIGWAVLEAWAVVTILRHRARWLVVLQPVLTTLVVVVTANHYWLDGLVGAALVVIAIVVLDQVSRVLAARAARHGDRAVLDGPLSAAGAPTPDLDIPERREPADPDRRPEPTVSAVSAVPDPPAEAALPARASLAAAGGGAARVPAPRPEDPEPAAPTTDDLSAWPVDADQPGSTETTRVGGSPAADH